MTCASAMHGLARQICESTGLLAGRQIRQETWTWRVGGSEGVSLIFDLVSERRVHLQASVTLAPATRLA